MPPSTELPPAAWSADADVGAERRNQVPLSRSSRCLAGRRPAPGTTGHSEPEAGSLKPNGEAAAAWILVATRRPGNPPGSMMPPSRGAWRCKRGRGHSLAVRTKRNAGKRGAPKPCSRPLSDDRHAAAAAWVGSVRRHRALSQHWLRLRPSRVARQRIAHQHLATPRPPRGRASGPGARSIASCPADRRREPGCGAIRHPTYAAQSFIRIRRRSNRSLRR